MYSKKIGHGCWLSTMRGGDGWLLGNLGVFNVWYNVMGKRERERERERTCHQDDSCSEPPTPYNYHAVGVGVKEVIGTTTWLMIKSKRIEFQLANGRMVCPCNEIS